MTVMNLFVLFLAAAISRVPMLAEAATSCNGSSNYCQLPFDRYTFAGTHNSAAYHLKPDCTLATGKCSKAIGTCIETGSKCSQPWREKCRETQEKCNSKVPPWLGKVCDTWGKTCTATSRLCDGWTDICKVPLQACSGSAPIICNNAPEWFMKCLWENQPGKDIKQQLADGIRSFDIDTCVTHDGNVVTCHGMGVTRALGDGLDVHLQQIAEFLNANRDQVIAIEYMDTDGDTARSSTAEPWPTLGQMIDMGKQVVIFSGSIADSLPGSARPAWIHNRDSYYRNTWNYANGAHSPNQMADIMLAYNPSGSDADRWQCVDFEYSPDSKTLLEQMKNGNIPSICLERLATDMNRRVPEVVNKYADRFRHVHRVRVDYYYNAKDLLFNSVKKMNARNFQLFARPQ
ncbi:PLC-like phosphodiesterase [Syncephalis fuscata]|nr:PLC-like phosphodiesterase [Syncephalis fuscata]